MAVAGDTDDVLVENRSTFVALVAEPDPQTKLRMLADMICDIQERLAPIQRAAREAAAVDETMAADWRSAHELRLKTFERGLRSLPAGLLRHSPEQAVATAWAIGSTEVYTLMTTVLGYEPSQVRAWLGEVLVDALLRPAGGD